MSGTAFFLPLEINDLEAVVLEKAASIAGDNKVCLHHVINRSHLTFWQQTVEQETESRERLEAQAKLQLDALARQFELDGESQVSCGHVAQDIIKYAELRGTDTIILGTHQRSWGHPMLGSTALKVLAHSNKHILMLTAAAKNWWGQTNLLVALDLQSGCELVLEKATALASHLNTGLDLVYVVDLFSNASISDEILLKAEDLYARVAIEAKQKIAHLIHSTNLDVDNIYIRRGEPSHEIAQQLDISNNLLLVMGHGDQSGLLLGSCVDHLVQSVSADVFVVRL